MSGKIVMGYWDCPYCGTRKIKGTYKDCQYCGAPRDKGTDFYMEGEVIYLSEEEAELKGKGADWHCAYCDSLESVLNDTCQHCGATREESSKNYFQLQEEKKRKKLEEKAYERSLRNPSYYEKETYEHEMYEEKTEKSYDDYTPSSDTIIPDDYQKNTSNNTNDSGNNSNLFTDLLGAIGGFFANYGAQISVGIVSVLLFVGLIWLFIPKPKTVEITEMSWENNIRIESYETVREDGWTVPSGGRIVYTQEEIHHYDQVLDHYETKTRTYTEQEFSHYETSYSYSDNGDGTFTEHTHQTPVYETVTKTETYEEPVYVDVPVYQTKYYYDIDKWIYKRSVTTKEADKNPYWGEVILAENERENGRSTSYYISGFETKDDEKKIERYSSPEDIWKDLKVGDVVTFEVTIGNTITELTE